LIIWAQFTRIFAQNATSFRCSLFPLAQHSSGVRNANRSFVWSAPESLTNNAHNAKTGFVAIAHHKSFGLVANRLDARPFGASEIFV
jgi:hypothetical protein